MGCHFDEGEISFSIFLGAVSGYPFQSFLLRALQKRIFIFIRARAGCLQFVFLRNRNAALGIKA